MRLCVWISELSLAMLALTDPTRSYDNGKQIGRELMESFRADSVCPARLHATARTSQSFDVTQNSYAIESMRTFVLCMPDSDGPFGLSM
jgi:hypothetical protein